MQAKDYSNPHIPALGRRRREGGVGYLSCHKSVHARGVVVDIQVIEDERNCVCVCALDSPQAMCSLCMPCLKVSFVCLPSLKLQLSSVAALRFAKFNKLGPALFFFFFNKAYIVRWK